MAVSKNIAVGSALLPDIEKHTDYKLVNVIIDEIAHVIRHSRLGL